MAVIFIMTTLQKPANLAELFLGSMVRSRASALAPRSIVALHLYFAGYWGNAPGPEDPWIKGLAEHLTKTEAKFYGASWCPHCNEQKQLFGSSGKRIPYVECSPGGAQGPLAAVCKEKDIQKLSDLDH